MINGHERSILHCHFSKDSFSYEDIKGSFLLRPPSVSPSFLKRQECQKRDHCPLLCSPPIWTPWIKSSGVKMVMRPPSSACSKEHKTLMIPSHQKLLTMNHWICTSFVTSSQVPYDFNGGYPNFQKHNHQCPKNFIGMSRISPASIPKLYTLKSQFLASQNMNVFGDRAFKERN